jgi:predicted dienelactone hydrolase
MLKFAISFLLLGLHAQAESFGIGQNDFTFHDKTRTRTLKTYLWYPVDEKAKMIPLSPLGPFAPVMAAKDETILKTVKKFPLILLSHGSGGKSDKLFWLTQYYVRNGFMVLGVDHAGNMTGDNSADGMMRVWERARDLSFALDSILKLNHLKSRIDLTKVAAAGHSAGGTTVLFLAGGRFASDRYTSPIPTCDGTKDPYLAKICDEMKTLDLKEYPKNVIESDYSDARIKAVVALDPGFVRSFIPESLKSLKAKPHLFLAEKLNTSKDQILAKEFVELFPLSDVEIVPGSYHMTFIAACKPNFPKDEPELKELCVENDRKIEIQRGVAEKSLTFFKQALGVL